MPKKQYNAFYFYMKELEVSLRREGRVFPNGMADVVPIAHPRWKALPQKEKDRFEKQAKEYKARMRGQDGDKYKQDNQGNILAHRRDPYTELEKRRMAEKKDIVKNWPPGKELANEEFYFINFQSLCVTEDGDYLPCEIAVIEFSIAKGITKTLHRFINPGRIPTGYRYTCLTNSDDTHQIPIDNFDLADDNYRGLWIQLENFINPNGEKPEYPPLYCLGMNDDYKKTEYCLEWIHGRSCLGVPNRIRRVYEIESLLQAMHAHIGSTVSKSSCIDLLTSSEWDYQSGTRCDYHEEKEVKHCSLGIVNRYVIVADTLIYGTPSANRVDPDETAPTGAVSSGSTLFANTSNHVTMRYAIADNLCGAFDVKLTPKHVPMQDNVGAITVLSPTSMPVCNRQDSRISQRNDAFPPPRHQPKRAPEPQQDYSKLRIPQMPDVMAAPVSAPAWGGQGMTGAMGGPSDYSMMGGVRGGIMGGPSGDDFSRGRGVSMGLDDDFPSLSISDRGAPLQQQTMPGMGRGLAPPMSMGRGISPPMSPGRGTVTPMANNYAGRAMPPQPSEAPAPPAKWQQAPTMPSQRPAGVGRGMVANSVPATASSFMADDSLAGLRIPGQPAPLPGNINGSASMALPSAGSYAGGQQDMAPLRMPGGAGGGGYPNGQFSNAEPETESRSRLLGVTGRGRGALLEEVMKKGVRPKGRGFVPDDWVDDGSLGPVRR